MSARVSTPPLVGLTSRSIAGFRLDGSLLTHTCVNQHGEIVFTGMAIEQMDS
jgi:hypothetical protein